MKVQPYGLYWLRCRISECGHSRFHILHFDLVIVQSEVRYRNIRKMNHDDEIT